MKRLATFLITALLLSSGCNTPSAVSPLLTVSELGSYVLALPQGDVVLKIARHDSPPDNRTEDWMWLTIHDGETQLAYMPLHSSYGKFHLEAVDLDGDQVPEFVLITGTGRGTSARSETLSVYRFLDRSFLNLVSSTAYSGFAGGGLNWRYSHRYVDTDGNGTLDVVLELGRIPQIDPIQGNTAWVPTDTVKVMKWDQRGSNQLLHRTQ